MEKFDVIAITETWLDMTNKIFTPEVAIEGYRLFHKDRVGRRGGGVALYVRDTLQCSVNNSIRTEEISSETVWVDLRNGTEKIVLGVIYRPPNTGRDDSNILWQEIPVATHLPKTPFST